jgi:tetratricopeptide (TPR) repeat protein
MKKILFYLCVLIIIKAQAQQKIIDSLTLVLKQQMEDTNKVNTLNSISIEYGKINSKKAIEFSQKGISIAKKIEFKKGESELLSTLAEAYFSQDQLDSTELYYLKALQLKKEIKDKRGQVNCLNNLGYINLNRNQYQYAINNYTKSLDILESTNEQKLLSYNNIATAYLYMGSYENALKYYFTGLELSEKITDQENIFSFTLGAGNIYNVMQKYEDALMYYQKALLISTAIASKSGISKSLNNIGSIYEKLHKNDTALLYYSKSLKIKEEFGDKQEISITLMNIGNMYSSGITKNYEKALEYYRRALLITEETKDKYNKAKNLINIGILYSNKEDKEKAIQYLKFGLKVATEIESLYLMMKSNEEIADFHYKNNDFKNAYIHHKNYTRFKDSILNETTSKNIAEIHTKYESEKKEKDIQLLTKDKKLQVAEIGKQKLIKNLFIIGFAVAILVAFIVLRLFKATKKQKLIIEHQNEQIVESINYSKRIQNSLLPSIAEIKETIPSLFVLYEPKNIVSGDFYYFKQFENYSVLACVDCTGHGVPGGFMSTLGSLLLDKIVNDKRLKPSEILIQLNNEIIRILHQQAGGELQDGMDLSVCLIDKKNSSIEFSGARNGIIIVTNNEAKRYKANPLPVGGNYMKKGVPIERNFKTESIALNSSDWVFMYTDGFIEQIGGKENQPMNYEQFEKHLINTTRLNTDEEKIALLQSELTKWSGNNEQTDDVLIIGFKVV